MMSTRAKWVGPYEAVLADGTVLLPGETIIEISEGEAKESAHWEPVAATRKSSLKTDPEE